MGLLLLRLRGDEIMGKNYKLVEEVKEGTVEIHMKLKGINYALGLRLDDFPSEEKLVLL